MHGMVWVRQETILKAYLLDKDNPQISSTIQGIWHHLLGLRPNIAGNTNGTRNRMSDLGEAPETFTGRILFMLMFNDISCDRKGNKENVWQMPESSKYLRRKLVLDNGHLLVQVLKRSGILGKRIVHKELGIISRTKSCWNSQKADILFSVQRLHCPGYTQEQRTWKTVDSLCCRPRNH